MSAMDNIIHVDITPDGYEITHMVDGKVVKEIVDEDDQLLLTYIENGGIIMDDFTDNPGPAIEDTTDEFTDAISENISGGMYRRGLLSEVIKRAGAAGLDAIMTGIIDHFQTDIERWKSDGDIDRLNSAFTNVSDDTIKGFLNYKLPGDVTVQQYTISMLSRS